VAAELPGVELEAELPVVAVEDEPEPQEEDRAAEALENAGIAPDDLIRLQAERDEANEAEGDRISYEIHVVAPEDEETENEAAQDEEAADANQDEQGVDGDDDDDASAAQVLDPIEDEEEDAEEEEDEEEPAAQGRDSRGRSRRAYVVQQRGLPRPPRRSGRGGVVHITLTDEDIDAPPTNGDNPHVEG
jgi:hypothetical protein